MKNFEEKLREMSKPEIKPLQHEALLAKALENARDQSVLSWWWLSVPLYILAALLMKVMYKPQPSFLLSIREITRGGGYFALLFFLVAPVVFIVVHFWNARRIYALLGRPALGDFVRMAWFNLLMMLLSICILIFYFL